MWDSERGEKKSSTCTDFNFEGGGRTEVVIGPWFQFPLARDKIFTKQCVTAIFSFSPNRQHIGQASCRYVQLPTLPNTKINTAPKLYFDSQIKPIIDYLFTYFYNFVFLQFISINNCSLWNFYVIIFWWRKDFIVVFLTLLSDQLVVELSISLTDRLVVFLFDSNWSNPSVPIYLLSFVPLMGFLVFSLSNRTS